MAHVDIGLDPLTDDLPTRADTITGAALGLQRVRNELYLFYGEWFLDTTRGLPLIDWLTAKNPDTQAILATLESTIRAIPGVSTTRSPRAQLVGPDLQISIDILFADGLATRVSIGGGSEAERNGTPFLVFFRQGAIPGGPAVL